jgi:hypothetical protein
VYVFFTGKNLFSLQVFPCKENVHRENPVFSTGRVCSVLCRIEGTPMLKLPMVKRLKETRGKKMKFFIKILHKNSSQIFVAKIRRKKFVVKIRCKYSSQVFVTKVIKATPKVTPNI